MRVSSTVPGSGFGVGERGGDGAGFGARGRLVHRCGFKAVGHAKSEYEMTGM